MKMAKASARDIDMAMDLIGVLDDIERGYFPHRFSDPDVESTEWIDTDDQEQYARLVDGQPIRKLLGMGEFDRLSDEQLAQAKAFGRPDKPTSETSVQAIISYPAGSLGEEVEP